eukprot:TRINITY_DN1791_c3_g1_i1.p1 TRINITY_DN1791_c3_g1~~TRINITY_DN1791_c3_g1_i1.p1  ORF type:complete len:310 (+),score=53.55 TRINITY_DN1791_c3_g1_i1:119-931(+)
MNSTVVVPLGVGISTTIVSGLITWNCLLRGEEQTKTLGDPLLDGVKRITIKRNEVTKRINVVTDAEETAKTVRQEFDIPRSRMMVVHRGTDVVPLRFDTIVHGESLDMPDDPRDWVEVSNQLRKDGNSHFNTGNATGRRSEYTQALLLYKKAYQIVPADGGDEAVSMICLAKNNCAQIFLKLDSCKYADQICTEVLSSDPKNMKALYRRGLARRRLSLLEQSLADQKLALEIATSQDSPLVSEIRREYDEVSRLLAAPKPVSLSKSQDLD